MTLFYRFFQYIGENSLELRHPRKYTKYLKGGMAHKVYELNLFAHNIINAFTDIFNIIQYLHLLSMISSTIVFLTETYSKFIALLKLTGLKSIQTQLLIGHRNLKQPGLSILFNWN